MHLAFVSTYPPTRCGIANYSQQLMNACAAEGIQITILAEAQSPGSKATPWQDADSPTIKVRPCWHRKENWVEQISENLREISPDVLHVQHEEAILGQDGRMAALLSHARALNIATAVTLHSVYDGHLGFPGIRWTPIKFQRSLGKLAGQVIVHQDYGCQDTLLRQGLSQDKVSVIHHGTLKLDIPTRSEARQTLGLEEEEQIVLAMGFIHKKKGLHTLVENFADVRAEQPKAKLLVAGSFRERPWDWRYNKILRKKIDKGVQAGWLEFREGFHSADDMEVFMAAADLLALPYRQSYGSASGVLHLALAAGKPVVLADGYKFADAKAAWGHEMPDFFPNPHDARAWSNAIIKALSDPTILEELSKHATALGKATSWPIVAKEHLTAYDKAREL